MIFNFKTITPATIILNNTIDSIPFSFDSELKTKTAFGVEKKVQIEYSRVFEILSMSVMIPYGLINADNSSNISLISERNVGSYYFYSSADLPFLPVEYAIGTVENIRPTTGTPTTPKLFLRGSGSISCIGLPDELNGKTITIDGLIKINVATDALLLGSL